MQPRFRHDVTVFCNKKAHSLSRARTQLSRARTQPSLSSLLDLPFCSDGPSFAGWHPFAKGPDRKSSTRRQEKAQTESIKRQATLDGQQHSHAKRAANAQADKIGPLPLASFSCRQGSPC